MNLLSKMCPNDFNWESYLQLNTDLDQSIDETACIIHYIKYGMNENRIYKNPDDFDWKLYLKLNQDLDQTTNEITCIKHFIKYGINEKRQYKLEPIIEPIIEPIEHIPEHIPEPIEHIPEPIEPIPESIEPIKETILEPILEPIIEPILEPILQPILEPIKEPILQPIIEPIKEPIKVPIPETNILPFDFDWLNYLIINQDISAVIKTKEETENHYIKHGKNENRSYKFLNGMKMSKLYYSLTDICNLFETFFNIIYNVLGKNTLTNTNLYDKLEIGNDINKKIYNYKNYNQYNNKSFLYLNNKTRFDNDIIKSDKLCQKDKTFLDIYDKYIIIIDTPNYCVGGTKMFTQTIINKYKNVQNFLLIKSDSHKTCPNFSIYINNTYLINTTYNYDELFGFFLLHKEKIKKIFINNLIGYSNVFISALFSLNIKITAITHDHYLLFNTNITLLYNDLYDNICKKKYREINFKLFDNIIIQNSQNMHLFGNNTDLFDFNKIIISPLPDFMEEDKIIKTNNKKTIIGIIGSISNIKGSNLLLFLIKYFENSDIKIVIFGEFEFNYEYKYIYNNIIELNELLIIHKPNMLLELSLWQETYGYTLTLAMITKLPIISIEKPFISVVEERLSKYNNTHTFNNLKSLKEIISKVKQDFFYTIKPKIFYNDFWDSYFGEEIVNTKIECVCPELIERTKDKNIVMITSKIYISNNPFTYSNSRSIYSSEERLEQTLNTIESIKQYIPDYFIILIDNSYFSTEIFELLKSKVDCFLNILGNEQLNYYTEKCPIKYLSDLSHQICVYKYFLKYVNNYNIKNLFKISGRYKLNETFDYNQYDSNDNIFKLNDNVKDRNYYYTSFYKISNTFMIEYFNKLDNIFRNKEEYNILDLEVIFGFVFSENMTLVNNLGITQYISCWNEITYI
jgi:hypothetical protein